MIPDEIVDQIKAVKKVLDSGLTAAGGIKGSVDLAAALPAASLGSSTLLGSLDN